MLLNDSSCCFLTQKFNDFLSLFDQLLSEVTMEVDGKQVKRWTGGNLREIISAQVDEKSNSIRLLIEMIFAALFRDWSL